MKSILILFLLVSNYLFSQYIFRDNNIQQAVDLYIDYPEIAKDQYGEINTWDVSLVTNMNYLFKDKTSFNSDISSWDVSNVKYMSDMFYNATSFNQNISSWDVSNVRSMTRIFYNAVSFNQPIGNWNTISLYNMMGMFHGASNFNHPIGNWSCKPNSLQNTFKNAVSFNQPLDDWDTSNTSGMNHTFEGAISFNQDLNSWDVSSVTNMRDMFKGAILFNKPLNNWNVTNVEMMSGMFNNTIEFNQDISSWNVSNVKYFDSMFEGASSFNQPIGNWNISTFCDLRNMFKNSTSFNQDISEWNFHGLYSVYSDYVDNSYKESYFINNTSISTFNYDKLIKNITLQYISGNYQRSSIIFYNNNVSYCNETYRDYLINEKGWVFNDGGQDCSSLSIEQNYKNHFNIYPNPTNNILNLDFNDYKSSELFSIDGKSVLKSTLKQIDLSKEVRGIYFLVIEDTTGKKSNGIKVVKL